jgi:hypothetical protein
MRGNLLWLLLLVYSNTQTDQNNIAGWFCWAILSVGLIWSANCLDVTVAYYALNLLDGGDGKWYRELYCHLSFLWPWYSCCGEWDRFTTTTSLYIWIHMSHLLVKLILLVFKMNDARESIFWWYEVECGCDLQLQLSGLRSDTQLYKPS